MRYFKEACAMIIMEIIGYRLSRGGDDVGTDVVHVLMLTCLGILWAVVLFLSVEASFKKHFGYGAFAIIAVPCGVVFVKYKGYRDTRSAVAFQLGFIALGVVCLSILSGKLLWLFKLIWSRVINIHKKEYTVINHEHACGCKKVEPCTGHSCGCKPVVDPCTGHTCGCKQVDPCTAHSCGCKPVVDPCTGHTCGCKQVDPCTDHSCGCKPVVDPCTGHTCGCKPVQPPELCTDHNCGCKPVVDPCTGHTCGCKPVDPCTGHLCGCKPVVDPCTGHACGCKPVLPPEPCTNHICGCKRVLPPEPCTNHTCGCKPVKPQEPVFVVPIDALDSGGPSP